MATARPPIIRDGVDLNDPVTLAERQLILFSRVVTSKRQGSAADLKDRPSPSYLYNATAAAGGG
jgi:hypothetical protein